MTKLKAALAALIALAALVFGFLRRGKQIEALKADVDKAKLAETLAVLKERAGRSQEDYTHAMEEYARLRSQHPDVFAELERRRAARPDGQPS
jgi:hypothetical protein